MFIEGVRAYSGTLPAPPNPRFQLLERAPHFTQRSKNILEGRWLLPSLQPSWEAKSMLGTPLGWLEAAQMCSRVFFPQLSCLGLARLYVVIHTFGVLKKKIHIWLGGAVRGALGL